MTKSLQDLIAQRDALEAQIEQTKQAELAGAIQQVRDLMAEHGLTIADLTTKRGPKAGKSGEASKVAAKYLDKATGATWSGRGLKPKWLKAALDAGAKIEDFAV